jgi:hypothetical protein
VRIKGASATIGDSGIQVIITVDEDLSDLTVDDLEIIFIKPNGETITRTPYSLTAYTVTYITYTEDFDQSGTWYIYLRNTTTGFEFNEGNNSFVVREKAEDMAML